MKYLASILFILAAATIARADFNTYFSAPSLAYYGQTYSVGGDVEETDDGNAFVEIGVYKDGYLMAYGSSQGTGSPPVYAAAGFSDSGGGNYSAYFGGDWAYATTEIDYDPHTIPFSLAASNLTPTSFLLTWQGYPSNADYEVSCNSTSLGTATGFSRSITGLQRDQTYVMQVRCYNAGQWSDWSQSLSVTLTDNTPPSAPVLQSPTHTPTSATLSWSASTDANGIGGYYIIMARGGAGVTVGSTSASVTTFMHARSPGTTYDYIISAVDGFGNFSSSNPVTSTTPTSLDSDSDGIPDQLETLFNNANPTADSALNLKTHRPTP